MGEPIEGATGWVIERFDDLRPHPTDVRAIARMVDDGDDPEDGNYIVTAYAFNGTNVEAGLDVEYARPHEDYTIPDAVLLALGYVRTEAERERVRAALLDVHSKSVGVDALATGARLAIREVADRLGIDLRQPAGKGEG